MIRVQWETTIKSGLPVVAVAKMYNIADAWGAEWVTDEIFLFWKKGKQKELSSKVYKTIPDADWDRLWEEAKEQL